MKINFNHKNISGVYRIVNLVNGKQYIGSSISLYDRKHIHLNYLKNNNHTNKHLQFSYNKHGVDNFSFEVLETCDKEILLVREQYYIDTLNPQYNIRLIAESNLGYKHTVKACNKMSKSRKLVTITEDWKSNISKSMMNHVVTLETANKISKTKKGKRLHENSLKASRLSVIKPIIQYDKEMNIVNKFESITEASKKLKINKSNITSVCSNTRKTAGGFIFKYNDKNT